LFKFAPHFVFPKTPIGPKMFKKNKKDYFPKLGTTASFRAIGPNTDIFFLLCKKAAGKKTIYSYLL